MVISAVLPLLLRRLMPRGRKTEGGMVACTRFLAVALLVFGFATTAQAGTRLYTGALTISSFGNDTDDGTAVPFTQALFFGNPFGYRKCDTGPYHPQETVMFTDVMGPKGTYNVTFTIPAYGGGTAVYDTDGDGYPDRAAGCLDTQHQYGAPLTGGGKATTKAGTPPRFTLKASQLAKVTQGGSFTPYGPYVFAVTYADLRNQAGSFFAGNGPGDFTVTNLRGQQVLGRIKGSAGPSKFGGVMQLLGTYGDREGYYFAGHVSVFDFNWLFDPVGGTPNTSGGVITAGFFSTAMNYGYTTSMGLAASSTVSAEAFPWTTGKVTISAKRGPYPTYLARTGYDNRTPNGSGTIQLVSPLLTRWTFTGGQYETGGIGIMKLCFGQQECRVLPEPHELTLLVAGLSMLSLLYRWNRRSR